MEDSQRRTMLRKVRRSSELARLWCNEPAFSQLFSHAMTVQAKLGAKSSDRELASFLNNVVARLVKHPRDLLTLCGALEDERQKREFMRFYARHELADFDVLLGLVQSPEIFTSLPDDPHWMEVVVLLYGSTQLNEAGDRKLTISEIAPLGLDVERPTVRSLVGSAFDEGLLDESDRNRLLELFPGDKYFQSALEESSHSDTDRKA